MLSDYLYPRVDNNILSTDGKRIKPKKLSLFVIMYP